MSGIIPEGHADAQRDETHGAFKGDGQTVTLKEGPHQNAGKGISRAGIEGGNPGAFHLPEPVLFPVVGHGGAKVFFFRRGAGDDHTFRPHIGKTDELAFKFLLRDIRAEGFVQQKGRLRQIRGDDVGMSHELTHGLHHFRGLCGIQRTVVAEYGIHQSEAVGLEKVADAAGRRFELTRVAEKTGIHGVKLQSHTFPVIENGTHFVREIVKSEAADAGGLGRKYGCGQWADLKSHAGKYGNGHGERGTAEAGEIMNGGNALEGEFHIWCPVPVMPAKDQRGGKSQPAAVPRMTIASSRRMGRAGMYF